MRALLAAVALAAAAGNAPAEPYVPPAVETAALERLVAAYPDHLAGLDGRMLVWKDGTRMALDAERPVTTFEDWLSRPGIADMLAQPYDPAAPLPPSRLQDPGRARNAAFFARMYGDCSKGGVAPHLVEVAWLPSKGGGKVRVTRINGVAERVRRISDELDRLPARFDVFLKPSAGAYACRPVAGTAQASAHGYGIAIDIAVARAHYWRWARGGPAVAPVWRNEVPREIVEVLERHGFIWGGRWYHYDTMHFEYRPELLAPRADVR